MANILVLDIETAPLESYTWGLFDQNVRLNQIKTEWSILAYCAKWLNESELLYEDTGGRGAKHVRSDVALLRSIWKLLDKADIVVAQGAVRFDIRKINARLLMNDFGPYSPIRVIDTLQVARKTFGFTSNKLEWMSKHLTEEEKSSHKKFPGFELWTECLRDNPEAWKEMKKYNQQDVVACEQLYLTLRPWITNHPNLATYNGGCVPECPKCGSEDVQKRGYSLTQNGRYQRYQCNDCGGWSRSKSTVLTKEQRAELLV